MAIDPIGSRVITRQSLVGSAVDPLPAGRRYREGLGRTMAVARMVVMLVLASLAILVLLPAAIAAQAAAI